MPFYDYQCKKCEHTFEHFQSFSQDPLKDCPKCGLPELHRLITGGYGFSVKGGSSKSQAEGLGGRYVPMDSAEQKFESRMNELMGNGEI